MSSLTCPACYAATADGGLCTADTGKLKEAIETARWHRDQLIITTSRQDRLSADTVGGKSAEDPLPVNLKAGDILGELEASLATMAAALGSRQLLDLLQAGRQRLHLARVEHDDSVAAVARLAAQIDDDLPDEALHRILNAEAAVHQATRFLESVGGQMTLIGQGPDGEARWILGRLPDARLHADAARWLTVLRNLRSRTINAIDTPRELIPLGECGGELKLGQPEPCACACHAGGTVWRPPCDIDGGCGSVGCDNGMRPTGQRLVCDRRIYAEPGESVVTCPNCKTAHDVRVRRDAVLADSDHIHGRPRFLAAVMTAAGLRTTESMIRGWNRLGHIHQTFTDEANGETWYRLGDVREAWDKTRVSGDTQDNSNTHEAA